MMQLRRLGLIKSLSAARLSTFAACRSVNTSSDDVATATTTNKLLDRSKRKMFELFSVYEEAIGLKEIKQAQNSVLEAENKFVAAQNKRRQLNVALVDVQHELRSLRDEMDRLSRTDSRYLQLFTSEHAILKREAQLVADYKQHEEEERAMFFMLSVALRDSQEKERARVERTKYLQLGLSLACTVLGIASSYLVSYFRNSQIRDVLKYDTEQFALTKQMLDTLRSQHDESQVVLLSRMDEFGKSLQATIVSNKLSKDQAEQTTPPPTTKQDDGKSEPTQKQLQAESTTTTVPVRRPPRDDEEVAQVPLIVVNPYVASAALIIGFITLINK